MSQLFTDYVHPDFKMESDGSTPGSKENKDPSNGGNMNVDPSKEKRGVNTNKSNNSDKQKAVKPEYNDGLNDDEVFLQYGSHIDQQLADDKGTVSNNKSTSEITEEEDTTFDDEKDGGLLSGKRFIIEHFDDDQIEHLKLLIEEHNGIVTTIKDKNMADFVVLPMNVECDPNIAKEMVNISFNFYYNDIIMLLKVEFLVLPVAVKCCPF
jgi:hypothetical protein